MLVQVNGTSAQSRVAVKQVDGQTDRQGVTSNVASRLQREDRIINGWTGQTEQTAVAVYTGRTLQTGIIYAMGCRRCLSSTGRILTSFIATV